MPEFEPAEFAKRLDDLLTMLPENLNEISDLSAGVRTKMRERVKEVQRRLTDLFQALDPVKQPEHVFDPSDPKQIGELIARTLLMQPLHPLESVERFYGSGVYAIYYSGGFDAYQPISGKDHPIYIGKADPATHDAVTVKEQGERLSNRLRDHVRSLTYIKNLDVKDFNCRYLVVKSAWQEPAEDYLIQRFMPVWNKETGVCYGLGKHGDSPFTRKNQRSPWDTVHPGRPWAKDAQPNDLTPEAIWNAIRMHSQQHRDLQ